MGLLREPADLRAGSPGDIPLIANDKRRAKLVHFDTGGAILVTGAMLLAIYALVRAPEVGWNTTRTIAELGGVVVLLLSFLANERRHANPLVPLSIFRIKGLAAADATQIIAMAGFYSMFFFVTLYMQNVLRFSPTRAGVSYIPVTVGVAISAGLCSKLFARTGTRPIMVAGALLAAGGVYWLSRIPVHGSYLTDLLPGLMIMSIGLGAVFVGVQTAANAGVPPDKAGLAAALINASFQLGAALGLAIFSAVATSRTNHLLAIHIAVPAALTSGFHLALLVSSLFLVAAALIALRATNTRGEPLSGDEPEFGLDMAPVPAVEGLRPSCVSCRAARWAMPPVRRMAYGKAKHWRQYLGERVRQDPPMRSPVKEPHTRYVSGETRTEPFSWPRVTTPATPPLPKSVGGSGGTPTHARWQCGPSSPGRCRPPTPATV